MADPFCTFLNSQSFTTSSLIFPNYKPPKLFVPNLLSHNPVTIYSSRRRNLLNFCTPVSSTPGFDLVSTSERSDGSFVFRFGDASEIERIVGLEETVCEIDDASTSSSEVDYSENELGASDGGVNVYETGSDIPLELSERLVGVSQEEVHDCVSDISTNGSSISLLDFEDVQTQEGLPKNDDGTLGSTSKSVPDTSLRIESDGDSKNFLDEDRSNNDSTLDHGDHIVSVTEVPQCNVVEEISLENVSTKATPTEESAELDDVESSTMAVQADNLENPETVMVIEVPEVNVSEDQKNVRTEATETKSSELDDIESSMMATPAVNIQSTETVSFLDVAEADVSEETSEENVSIEAIGTEESTELDNVESSVIANQENTVESPEMVSVVEVLQNGRSLEISEENVTKATDSEEFVQVDDVESSIVASQANTLDSPEMVSVVEVPQNAASAELSLENASNEATETEESAQSDTVESPKTDPKADTVETPVILPIVEVPEIIVCEESSEENVSTVATGTDESAESDSVENTILAAQTYSAESPIALNESSPISTLEPELTEGETTSTDLAEVSSAGAVEVEITQTYVNGGRSSTVGLSLSSGAALLLHPSKALTGGEESYLVTNLNWLGVADGVGQWSLGGINPGVYARELMENCGKIVSNSSSISIINPLDVINRSVEEAQSPGPSTILVAYFDGHAQVLHVANIGDSGFIVIRDGAVHKRSSPMLHEFNFPMQIGKGHDPSEVVEEYTINLEEGDIVVTATDGLFDNLYEQEITSIVLKSLQANVNPQEIAKLLARRAQDAGKSSSSKSPFADAAQAAGYVGYTGGKLDDVAVIVSLVQNRPS